MLRDVSVSSAVSHFCSCMLYNIIEYYVVDIMLYPVEFCGNRRHDGFSNRGSRGCEDSQRWRRPHERIFIVL